MRFNAKFYEQKFPRVEKPVENFPGEIDPEDQMTDVPKKKEETADGDGTDSEPDSE